MQRFRQIGLELDNSLRIRVIHPGPANDSKQETVGEGDQQARNEATPSRQQRRKSLAKTPTSRPPSDLPPGTPVPAGYSTPPNFFTF